MSVGDLVMFRNCAQSGKAGIISVISKPSELARKNPDLMIYWVICSEGVQCFTGSQLVLI